MRLGALVLTVSLSHGLAWNCKREACHDGESDGVIFNSLGWTHGNWWSLIVVTSKPSQSSFGSTSFRPVRRLWKSAMLGCQGDIWSTVVRPVKDVWCLCPSLFWHCTWKFCDNEAMTPVWRLRYTADPTLDQNYFAKTCKDYLLVRFHSVFYLNLQKVWWDPLAKVHCNGSGPFPLIFNLAPHQLTAEPGQAQQGFLGECACSVRVRICTKPFPAETVIHSLSIDMIQYMK